MNFPYIILDRALLYYAFMLNWAQGRRDYPENSHSPIGLDDSRPGLTSSWSLAEKRACQSYFRAIQKGEEFKKQQARESITALLLKTMESMPGRDMARFLS